MSFFLSLETVTNLMVIYYMCTICNYMYSYLCITVNYVQLQVNAVSQPYIFILWLHNYLNNIYFFIHI